MGDFILILSFKILIIIVGNYFLIKWFNKNKTIFKMVICWVAGLFFNLLQPFTVYDGIFQNFILDDSSLLLLKDNPYGMLIALIQYSI